MGGHQVTNHGADDHGFDEDGYDESQRAEILEATRDGPGDGTIITDLDPDIDIDGIDDVEEDELVMRDDEIGEQDDTVDQDSEDVAEDVVQEEFDDGSIDDDEDLDDPDDIAINS